MNSILRTSVALIFVLLFCAARSFSQQSPATHSQTFPKVTIAGSQVRTMKSASTGRDYDLLIHLPSDYDKNSPKKYPVLYILDGQWDFKLTDSVLGGLVYDKFVPDIIMVGIAYSGENPDYDGLRAMDLTPTPLKRAPGSGDAPKFYKFLKSEVMPFIAMNYRADSSERYLQGSSLGGLFTLYAMFSDPSLFKGYVCASPAVTWDDNYLFRQEAEYASTHKGLAVRLYVAVGDSEGLTNPVRDFMKTLQSRNYNGLKLETRVVEGERHAGNKPEIYNRGMRFVFSE